MDPGAGATGGDRSRWPAFERSRIRRADKVSSISSNRVFGTSFRFTLVLCTKIVKSSLWSGLTRTSASGRPSRARASGPEYTRSVFFSSTAICFRAWIFSDLLSW